MCKYHFHLPFPEDHLTVKELVDLSLQIWGDGKMEINQSPDKLHEANLLQLDIDRVLVELNWNPMLNAKEAIRWTVEWYKTDSSGQPDFTFEQIDNYMSR